MKEEISQSSQIMWKQGFIVVGWVQDAHCHIVINQGFKNIRATDAKKKHGRA